VAAAALTLGPLVSPAMVLCRGEDGHVGLEAAFARCCQSDRAVGLQHLTRTPGAVPEPPCSECTDVSITHDLAPVPRGHAAPSPAAAERLTEPPPASPVSWSLPPQGNGGLSRDRDLAVVRSTVHLR
jgi:hypothetical protein